MHVQEKAVLNEPPHLSDCKKWCLMSPGMYPLNLLLRLTEEELFSVKVTSGRTYIFFSFICGPLPNLETEKKEQKSLSSEHSSLMTAFC
mmetsp:Transcript_46208/g.67511  ORF Transcript_46208/g.67511 Transcript_46208/m.67511 type:complete len:89 (-) Transcript_46208:63-329(-)